MSEIDRQVEGLAIPGELTPTGLKLPKNLTLEEWTNCGKVLVAIGDGVKWWRGDWMTYGEDRADWGETYAQPMDDTRLEYQTLANEAYVSRKVDFSRRRENLSWSHHDEIAAMEPDKQVEWLDRAEEGENGKKWSRQRLRSEIGREKQRELMEEVVIPEEKYRTIVIDPPWEMQKIERDVRPRQRGFDYPTMDEDELRDFEPMRTLPADDCHLYLWTTHKHLPSALRLAEAWGFRYQCLLTWVKNVGITPFSWMYSTELVLFCRKGGLDLNVYGKRLDFNAKVREHSRKPDEFYDLVREVSPAPRIDVFSREEREGFDGWGNETARFKSA